VEKHGKTTNGPNGLERFEGTGTNGSGGYADHFTVFFVRVLPDLSIHQLRAELIAQLDEQALPESFAYVRGVGRHFTEVR
jgi:hypothetical protein